MSHQYLRSDHAPRAGVNRRASFRYTCPPATLTRVYLSAESTEPIRGWAVDLSTNGIGLSLSGPLTPGAFGIVRIKSADGSRGYDLTAQVVHSTLQASGEWLVGFEFVKSLEQNELEDLL